MMTDLKEFPRRPRSKPARFPPSDWPFALRADIAAAALDFDTSADLWRAVACGDAPRPSGWRGRGRSREAVWIMADVQTWIANRYPSGDGAPRRRLEEEIVQPKTKV
jgi:hypothetical protein